MNNLEQWNKDALDKIQWSINLGKKSVMYCLYREVYSKSDIPYWKHVKNLSEDLETAKTKAVEYVSQQDYMDPYKIEVIDHGDYQNKRAEDLYFLKLKFGKYKGQFINNLIETDIKYVIWLYGGAKKKEKNIQDFVKKGFNYIELHHIQSKNWSLVLTKMDKWLIKNSSIIWETYFEKFPKKPTNWVGEIGKKYQLQLTYVKSLIFDNFDLEEFQDKEGNIFQYFGSKIFEKDGLYSFKISDHREFKNKKINKISYVKLIK